MRILRFLAIGLLGASCFTGTSATREEQRDQEEYQQLLASLPCDKRCDARTVRCRENARYDDRRRRAMGRASRSMYEASGGRDRNERDDSRSSGLYDECEDFRETCHLRCFASPPDGGALPAPE